MKIVFVQADGMASGPLEELGGQTPLQKASTPNLDALAAQGEFGHLNIPGEPVPLSGDRIHLALLGYDPHKYYSGPGPFEAASLGVGLEKQDIAFLCHLVTLRSNEEKSESKKLGAHLHMVDDRPGGIEPEDARDLIDAVNDQMASETIQFYSGKGHRHLMVWAGGIGRLGCTNPHAALGQSIEPFLPTGEGSDIVKELMEVSRIVLREHPVNREREEGGLNPANCLWLWGIGKAIELTPIGDRWGISGATISTVDLHLGVGISAGLEAVNPFDYEEFDHSNVGCYAQICNQALQTKDLVYLHIPSRPQGDSATAQDWIKDVEAFDDGVIGTLLPSLKEMGDFCLVVVCNQEDQAGMSTASGVMPFVNYKSGQSHPTAQQGLFCEKESSQRNGRDATRMMERLLANT